MESNSLQEHHGPRDRGHLVLEGLVPDSDLTILLLSRVGHDIVQVPGSRHAQITHRHCSMLTVIAQHSQVSRGHMISLGLHMCVCIRVCVCTKI